MKRIIWQAFLILFVAGILAMLAFGPRPQNAIPPGRVRITYWEKWNGLEGQQAQPGNTATGGRNPAYPKASLTAGVKSWRVTRTSIRTSPGSGTSSRTAVLISTTT